MNSEINLLQTSISAMHKQEYPRAIEALEAFCRHNTNSKPSEYFEAQRWLIKAYQRNGQVNLAVYLCQQMTTSPNAQTRSWAKSNLQWLQEESATKGEPVVRAIEVEIETVEVAVTPTIANQNLTHLLGNTDRRDLLSSAEVDRLLKDGQKALKMGRFAESIEKLEAVCAGIESTDKDLAQTQMSLVKAYQGGEQLDRAIALCGYLKTSEKEYVQIWATEFLRKLTPDIETEPSSPAVDSPSAPSWTDSQEDEQKSDQAPIFEDFWQDQSWENSRKQDPTAKVELASRITLFIVATVVLGMSAAIGYTVIFPQSATTNSIQSAPSSP